MPEIILAVLPLREVVVFPHMLAHLDVGREKSVTAIEAALAAEKRILLLTQNDGDKDDPQSEDLYDVGTVAEIRQTLRLPGGAMRILVEGLYRGKVLRISTGNVYFSAGVVPAPDERAWPQEIEPLAHSVRGRFEELGRQSKKISAEQTGAVAATREPGRMADLIATHLNLKTEEKQRVLAALDVASRLERVAELIMREMEIIEVERRISLRVRRQMEKTQKDYYLREQIKSIQKELGERDERQSEAEEYRGKIKNARLSSQAEEQALKEVERLEKMPLASAEGTVSRTYIDWLLAAPWEKTTADRKDLARCARILDEDHYGLTKVKERIVEFLAVRRLAPASHGPIICLVGPPGAGKTSLARSIARALGREFVRVSLGGIRDEAEIRGHRRTYIGALPGRVIQGMRRAGVRNPVFLFDEIDKMQVDFRGDPAAALLEALDPEQNVAFTDHYLEVPFDLSQVIFITTANTADTIPAPLLDRMEIIRLSGYTENEKMEIAARHLAPKQLKEHGLSRRKITFSPEALLTVIREYTREAGVRSLERELAHILRKIAVKLLRRERFAPAIVMETVREILGPPPYRLDQAASAPEIGLAAGLAYTQVGGEILFIEATPLRGEGKLVLTGKLGEVMQESAQAGWTYVRARAASLGIEPDFYEHTDVHIHVPEGATPKDGPSAGVTMVTAMASALARRPVRQDLAMTGEITLRGKVLPIGGVKEKVLAARRAGIKTVLLPRKNEKDLEEIPAEIRQEMEFILVERVEEALTAALAPEAPEPGTPMLGDFASFSSPAAAPFEHGSVL
ncbi:MAG: endopeptidase La [Gracilibacteraceae bacterium]|jgi:ATP-dependent Lon protease|nr:endopeptidase La [Gracilibacteraceae bacterium]